MGTLKGVGRIYQQTLGKCVVAEHQWKRLKTARKVSDLRFMQNHGSKILVIELQGPLFFGSAKEVAREIDAASHGAEYIFFSVSSYPVRYTRKIWYRPCSLEIKRSNRIDSYTNNKLRGLGV